MVTLTLMLQPQIFHETPKLSHKVHTALHAVFGTTSTVRPKLESLALN
jgi:hypothetical protein